MIFNFVLNIKLYFQANNAVTSVSA